MPLGLRAAPERLGMVTGVRFGTSESVVDTPMDVARSVVAADRDWTFRVANEISGAGRTGGIEARPAEYEERVVGFFDRELLGPG